MRNRPIVQAAAAWVLGYCLAEFAHLSWLGWKAGAAGIVLWASLGVFKPPGSRFAGPVLLLLIAASYYAGYDQQNVTEASEQVQAASDLRLEGVITSTVKVDGDKVSFVLRADRMMAEGLLDKHQNKEDVQISIRLQTIEEQHTARGWGRGDRIALSGSLKAPEPARNFGGFDYKRYLYLKHIHWIVSVKGLGTVEVSQVKHAVWSSLTLLRWNDDTRMMLGGRFDRLFDSTQAGYMKSLVLGIREDLDTERFQQFSKLGLTHILAISGLHVAVFVAGCLFLLRVLGFTKEKALIITIAFVPIYTAIAGGSPSVVRAGLMAMIALYAARRGILKDGLHILSAVALMMLVWEPYYLFDISFQLSFIVTVGLIVGVPRFSKLLPIRSPMLNSAIAVTTVAQMISFPISIYYFNSFSLLSWFANLLLVPFISFLTLPLGSVALMLSFVWLRAGDWVAWLADWCNRLTFWSVQEGAAYRAAQQIWPTPSLVWISLYFVLLYLMYRAFCFWKANGRLGRAVAASCAMLALLAYGYTPAVLGRSGEVSFLDVGQGDSILIRSPQGRIMLIDGGGTLSFRKPGEEWKERQNPYEVGEKLLVPLLKKRGIHRIDYLVISHQDADHIGGLQAVVEQIPVKAVLFNDSWKGNESSQKLFETALQHGAQLLGGGAGAKVTLDKFTKLTVIGPDPEDNNSLEIVDDQNGESLVMWMSMFDSQFLFTGDIGLKQEASLLQSLASKQSLWLESGNLATTARTLDVLKIAHHGSKSSTTAEWLQFWKPHQAVISVGASNSYGHPNPQVIERIQSIQADIHRTDRDGEVVYHVTRNGLKVQQKLFGL